MSDALLADEAVEQALLIDQAVPCFDARLAVHHIVDAGGVPTWDALLRLDLMTVHTPLLDAAFWLRGLPARLGRREVRPPPALVLGESGHPLPGWVQLGVHPPRELALGAVGRFWTPTITWDEVPADSFAAYAEPGRGKIGVSFSLRAYGEHRTLLSYECRTVTTDPDSRAAFLRYWRIIRPFVAHIMRATVRSVVV
jgi:hypothetical protein